MDRKSQKRYHDDDDDTKLPEKKVKDWGETECTICRLDFEEGDKTKKLNCGHKFHEDCVNAWLSSRRLQAPTCPTCNQKVDESLLPIVTSTPQVQNDVSTPEIEAASDREFVKTQDEFNVPIFFGVVVCLKDINGGKTQVGKYFNVDLGLVVDSTIGDLRTAVLNKSNEWGNISSSQRFRINRMYYGTPANCEENPHLYKDITGSQVRKQLIDIYEDYYKKLHQRMNDIREQELNNYIYEPRRGDKYIEDLYYLHEYDVGNETIQADYFYNEANPNVPIDYILHPHRRPGDQTIEHILYAVQPREVRQKSTYTRIAWVIIEVEKVHEARKVREAWKEGGSTRKKRRIKRRKSHKQIKSSSPL